MISEKALKDEIQLVKHSMKRYLKEKEYHQLHEECIILDTLEFMLNWNENE